MPDQPDAHAAQRIGPHKDRDGYPCVCRCEVGDPDCPCQVTPPW